MFNNSVRSASFTLNKKKLLLKIVALYIPYKQKRGCGEVPWTLDQWQVSSNELNYDTQQGPK